MTPDPCAEAVLAIVARVAGPRRTPPDAGPDTPLGEGGFWLDSLDTFEVVLACEEAFGLLFDPDRDLTADAFRTVGSLAAAVGRRSGR